MDNQSESILYKSALLSDDIAHQINSVLQSNETEMNVDEMLTKAETILSSSANLSLEERKIFTTFKTKKQKMLYIKERGFKFRNKNVLV